MAPRTILYTGKGGVGKTSVAAATARRCAAAGLRTIVLSTDPAHSLADVLDVEIGGEADAARRPPVGRAGPAQDEIEQHWTAVHAWAWRAAARAGRRPDLGRGAHRAARPRRAVRLLRLRRHAESGEFDVVVVDCAPTGETLRLLSLPDVARWWLDRVFPQSSAALDAARPFARAVLDVALPDDDALDEVNRLVTNLIAMNAILRDREHVSLRLVMTPDRMVIDEARRTFTYLNLYGFLTDAVVVNRLFPEEVGAYFGPWRERQLAALDEVRDAFAPVPVLCAPYFASEPVGGAPLDELGGALFGAGRSRELLHTRLAQELRADEGSAVLRLDLPFATKGDISLRKIGSEVVVRVDGHKRTVVLRPPWRAIVPTAPPSPTARSSCASPTR